VPLVVTVRPFVLNGRLRPVGDVLSQDDSARVQAIPNLRSLCVSTNAIPFAAQPPDNAAPVTQQSVSEGS
jgi:hypothetical protein